MHRFCTAIFLITVIAAGCQRYRPDPLDLRRHADRWAARDPAAAGVAQYAGRLAGVTEAPPAPFDVTDGLSLREGEAVALFFNPRLRVARLKARVPLLGAREAGRWEDPELAIDGERIVESVDDPWVLGGLVRFTIPLSGRLGVERERAFADADAELLRAYVEETTVLAELRAAWVAWTVAGQRRELASRYLNELEEVLRSAERLLKAGEIAATDVRLFQIERVKRRGEILSFELEQRERAAAVKGLLGLMPDAPVELTPSLPATAIVTAAAERRRWAEEHHPRILLARAEHVAAEKSLELETRKQYPDLALGGGYGTDEGQSRILFGAGLPLPLLNRNRRAIAEARGGRDVAKAGAESTFEDVVGRLLRAELAAESARVRRQFIETDVVPLVNQQVGELRRLGGLGDFNTLVLLEALRAANEAKVQLLDARSIEATATNELNASAGVELFPRGRSKDGQR